MRLYKEFLAHFPTAEAHTFLGWVYATINRYEPAIEECHRAIAAPRYDYSEFAHFNLGRVYEHAGQWPEHADCYRAALRANRDYAVARQALRRLIARQN